MTAIRLLLVIALAARASLAAAQGSDPLAPLTATLKPGAQVYVIDRAGRETRGTLRRISPSSLAITSNGAERVFLSGDIERIEEDDANWNGALLGGAIGAAFGVGSTIGISCNPHCVSTRATGATAFGSLGLLVGAYIDRSMSNRTVLYTSDQSASRGAIASFASIPASIRTGDRIEVVTRDGVTSRGRFAWVSGTALAMYDEGNQVVRLEEANVNRVVKRGDPIWNGAAMGAGAGAFLGGSGCKVSHNCSEIVFGAVYFGAMGAWLDSLIGGHERVVFTSAGDAKPSSQHRVQVGATGSLTRESKTIGLAIRF